MDEARLTVRACGPLVSYQDAGRFGMLRFGVPASGPMDRLAHATANLALGRPEAATAIEVSMGGLELGCDAGEVSVGIAGGGFQVRHGGTLTPPWCVRTLRPGDTLSIRPGAWGSWAYLAFAGDLVCASWAGHTATHTGSGLGGGSLANGAAIVVRHPQVMATREGELPVPDWARPCAVARVVLGPQADHFAADATALLLQETFAVSPACDRMGMRLDGPRLNLRDALSIPSEPILRGSVQVSGDGVASILLADHQTTGGYPKIATVLSSDTDAVAQLRPRERLNFQAVDAGEAVRLVRRRAEARRLFLAEVAGPRSTLAERLMRENLISGVVAGPAGRADGSDHAPARA